MEKNDSKKSIKELLKEEQDKLLAEIYKKAKRRKSLMNPDTTYDKPHKFKNRN